MDKLTFNVLDLFQRADRITVWMDEHRREVVATKDFQRLAALNIDAVQLQMYSGLRGESIQVPAQEVEPADDGVVTFKDVGGRLYIATLAILRPFSPADMLEERLKPWNKDKDVNFFGA